MAVKRSRRKERKRSREMQRYYRRRIELVGFHLVGAVERLLAIGQPVRRAASGRLVGTTRATHGAPPRVLTGRLRQSIDHRIRVTKRAARLWLGAGTEYARSLERGGHPFLVPTIRKERKAIVRILQGKRR